MWNQAKDILYGKVNRMPERIIENNKIVIGSKNVANSFNRHFIRKVSEIEKNLPETDIDPMTYYKKYIPKLSNQFSMKEINRCLNIEFNCQKLKTQTLKMCSEYLCQW